MNRALWHVYSKINSYKFTFLNDWMTGWFYYTNNNNNVFSLKLYMVLILLVEVGFLITTVTIFASVIIYFSGLSRMLSLFQFRIPSVWRCTEHHSNFKQINNIIFSFKTIGFYLLSLFIFSFSFFLGG